MVVLVTSFSCTPDETSIVVFLSVTLMVLVLERCFSYEPLAYTPRAGFIEEFVFYTSRWFL